jgi:hypothetical protein
MRQTDKQTNRQAEKQINRQTDKKTNRQPKYRTKRPRDIFLVNYLYTDELLANKALERMRKT